MRRQSASRRSSSHDPGSWRRTSLTSQRSSTDALSHNPGSWRRTSLTSRRCSTDDDEDTDRRSQLRPAGCFIEKRPIGPVDDTDQGDSRQRQQQSDCRGRDGNQRNRGGRTSDRNDLPKGISRGAIPAALYPGEINNRNRLAFYQFERRRQGSSDHWKGEEQLARQFRDDFSIKSERQQSGGYRPYDRRDGGRGGHNGDRGENSRHEPNGRSFNRNDPIQPPKEKATYPLGFRLLTDLSESKPTAILDKIGSCREGLEKLIQQRDIQSNLMQRLLIVLGKLCTCETQIESVRDILSLLQEERFLISHIAIHVRKWDFEASHSIEFRTYLPSIIGWLIALLSTVLRNVKEAESDIGVVLLCLEMCIKDLEKNSDVRCPENVWKKFEELKETHVKVQRDAEELTMRRTRETVRNLDDDLPPENFTDLPILPTVSELSEDFRPFLRTNVVNGGYTDMQHYLDVHFRLLREDFVNPLRNGIAEYRRFAATRKKEKNVRFNDIRIYDHVRVLDIKAGHCGISYITQFSMQNLQQVKWERTKRLLFGSLVCLSADNFNTLFFAVVANRSAEQLQMGVIELRFEVPAERIRELFSNTFVMAESATYFEAYRHVLERLQKIDQETFPFQAYLISVKTEKVNPPRYLREKPDMMYDLSVATHSDKIKEPLDSMALLGLKTIHEVQVLGGAWPLCEDIQLDWWQMAAYHAALTEELCIIQGPPGTGKTYVGLKIVKTLLHNKVAWTSSNDNRPILLVCYTNHALDQFLEGILSFHPDGVVRIGGRSSSDKLKELSLNYLRRNRSRVGSPSRFRFYEVRDQMVTCAKSIQRIQNSINVSTTKILQEGVLDEFMTENQRQQIKNIVYLRRGNFFSYWLGVEAEMVEYLQRRNQGQNTKRADQNDQENEQEEQQGEELQEDQNQEAAPQGPEALNVLEEVDFINDMQMLEDIDDAFLELQVTIVPENFGAVQFSDKEPDDVDQNHYNVVGRDGRQRVNKRQQEEYIMYNLQVPDTMTPDEAEHLGDIWHLNLFQRWRIYRYWVSLYQDQLHVELVRLQAMYDQLSRILQEVNREDDVEILQEASIVAVTTTGAAKFHSLIQRIQPRIVVVEEAAEILEAHVVTSLTSSCEHLILIGDHQQLRPNPTVYQLAKKYKLDISLFERMINNKMPSYKLSQQHRMRPEIAELLRLHKDFYPGLVDHDSVKSYEDIHGVSKNMFFIDHSNLEQHGDENNSRSNLFEASFLASLCRYFLQQGYEPSQITILTAYTGQLWNFKNIMDKKTFEGVRACPVDSFQGEENDIILLSLVRSNEEGNIGFLKVSNRVCVALSRAKKGFFCVGNFTQLAKQNQLWDVIVEHVKKTENIGNALQLLCRNHPDTITSVACDADFKNVPDGGCNRKCEARLECGHQCQMKCHPTDQRHEKVVCRKPCQKTIIGCDEGHKCMELCFVICDVQCQKGVKKTLYECGHVMYVPCYQKYQQEICTANCEKVLACGHSCKNNCGQTCTFKCKEKVKKEIHPCGHEVEVLCSATSKDCPHHCEVILECGHQCKGTCGGCRNGRFHVACNAKCDRTLICGHPCTYPCSKFCPPCERPCENRCKHSKCPKTCGELCTPCVEPCEWSCVHMTCDSTCGEQCLRKVCNKPCIKKLRCGRNRDHRCIGLCGEKCPQKCRICNREEVTEVFLGSEDEPDSRFILLEECGHIFEVRDLDKWMNMEQNKDENELESVCIRLRECPRCKTLIRRNLRYSNMIKEARNDVERVKKKLLGEPEEIKRNRNSLVRKVRSILSANSIRPAEFKSKFFSTLRGKCLHKNSKLTERQTISLHFIQRDAEKAISLAQLDSVEKKFEMMQILNDLGKEANEKLRSLDDTERGKQLQQLEEELDAITVELRWPSNQQLSDWNNEFKRIEDFYILLTAMAKCSTVQYSPGIRDSKPKLSIDSLGMTIMNEVEDVLHDGLSYTDEKQHEVRRKFIELQKYVTGLGISVKERKMVVKAMGLSLGHWYKCPNNHIYAIGNCGGANQESHCPECNAAIGGVSHTLADGNAHAPEMDNSRYAAWSEGANLANFDLGGLI